MKKFVPILDSLFDLKTMIPVDGMEVFNAALRITENIAYLLPKNTNVDQVFDHIFKPWCSYYFYVRLKPIYFQLISMAGPYGVVEVEQNLLNTKIKMITAYYGELLH